MKQITQNLIVASIALIALSCQPGAKDNKNQDAAEQQASMSANKDKDEKIKLNTPKPSPLGIVSQKVGLTQMEVTYSRPGVKNREIFGGLVPYDKLWRTGANAPTKLELSTRATIEGNKIPAGKYALLTIPGKDKWTIIINEDTAATTDKYKKENDVARFKVAANDYPKKVETFTINFTDIRPDKANMQLLWENTSVKCKVEVPTDELVEKQIKEKLPKASDDNAMAYYRAAEYYHMAEKDLNQALKWINKALQTKEEYWMLHRKANIQAELGNHKDAIETAKKSKELAQQDGNEHYVKNNEEVIKKWKNKANM